MRIVDCIGDLERSGFTTVSGTAVRITQPVRFGADLETDLRHLKRLRDATSHAVRLTWTLEGRPLLNYRDYSHLAPPSGSTASDDSDVVAEWRSNFKYGTFYYRVGPGFVIIKDVRPGGDHSRMTISGADAERFTYLAQASLRNPEDDLLEVALNIMGDIGLARYTETNLVVLPFRIRHWPVPFLSI